MISTNYIYLYICLTPWDQENALTLTFIRIFCQEKIADITFGVFNKIYSGQKERKELKYQNELF